MKYAERITNQIDEKRKAKQKAEERRCSASNEISVLQDEIHKLEFKRTKLGVKKHLGKYYVHIKDDNPVGAIKVLKITDNKYAPMTCLKLAEATIMIKTFSYIEDVYEETTEEEFNKFRDEILDALMLK